MGAHFVDSGVAAMLMPGAAPVAADEVAVVDGGAPTLFTAGSL